MQHHPMGYKDRVVLLQDLRPPETELARPCGNCNTDHEGANAEARAWASCLLYTSQKIRAGMSTLFRATLLI